MTRSWQILIQEDGDWKEDLLNLSATEDTMRFLLNELGSEPLPSETKELSLLFCDDSAIHKLNHEYRGKDSPTDVLSFSQLEGESDGPISQSLGDLVISIPTALKQATEYNVSANQEISRLLIHGLLHLFGYDHEDVSEEEVLRMQQKEDELMDRLEDADLGKIITNP